MKSDEYQNINNLEFGHWWYQGLDDLLFQSLQRYSMTQTFKILDAGCGTGRIACKLLPKKIYGIDHSKEAVGICHTRGLENITLGSVTDLPYASEQFDLIISADVLYHKAIPDDRVVLKEFNRILRPGGEIILNLAALNILKGQHDEKVHTRERYNKKILTERVQQAGFVPVFTTYRLFFLFPLILGSRLLQRLFNIHSESSDIKPTSRWLNYVLHRIIRLENKLLRFLTLPFGSSIFMIAKKPL